jgi:asparagine synthase (glutamine-hydrolysing)
MCGFAGAIDLGASPTGRSTLEAMTAALAHRGPDGVGVDLEEGVGLGHRRLRVIDLSARADQPLWNEARDLAIVFNGEIYNFRELRRELEGRGARFKTESDTEVVLELYAREGDRFVHRLDGMFAFAIWDARRREKARLLLARDRSGKKPLFFYDDGRRFLFASEIKAIHRHPSVSREPNLEALPLYLTYGYFPSPLSPYAHVSALPPATWMVVEPRTGKRESRRYWKPTVGVDRVETLDEARDRLAPLLREAVRKRLLADVPIGAFLSGGLDSTIVVALMSERSARPVKTFSIGFANAPEHDELAYAEEAARRFGCDHESFRVAPPEPEMLARLVGHHDGPFGDSSAIPTYAVSQLARREVKVVLNGDGGDELFCGYDRLAAAALGERIPRPLRHVAALASRLLPEPRSHEGELRRVRHFLEVSGRPLGERIQAWCSFFQTSELDRLLLRAPRAQPSEHFGRVLLEVPDASPLAQVLYLNYRTYLPEDLLVKMDRMTMAHGLEARSPFLDTALTDFAGALPDSLKLRGLTTKHVLRQIFRDLVPDSILSRRKMGFRVPLGSWLSGELAPLLDAHLVEPSSPLYHHLRRGEVLGYVDEHRRGTRDRGQKLFCLLTLSIWLRSFEGD